MSRPALASPFVDHDIYDVITSSLAVHEDDRGLLVEAFREDDLSLFAAPDLRPRMSYLSVTHKDVVRGPHEHLVQHDVFVFFRSAFSLFLWDNRPTSTTFKCRRKIVIEPTEAMRVSVPPGVVHAYRAEQEHALVMNYPSSLYAGWKRKGPVDEIRHEADPASPFQLW